MMAVGGGQRKLKARVNNVFSFEANDAYRFSVPYDFCATLLDMTMMVRSPNASLLGVRTYCSRNGLW